MTRSPWAARGIGAAALSAAASVLAATALVWVLQQWLGVADASPAYLLAVTVVAIGFGTVPAALTALLSVLVYNFLFTHPLYTLVVADSGQLLNLALLLVVGVVVGQLTALQHARAEAAEAREREARVLVLIGRALATRRDTAAALEEITAVLADFLAGARVWVALGDTPARERRVAASAEDAAPDASSYAVLQRRPGDEPPRWMLVRAGAARGDGEERVFRIPVEAGGTPLGAIWVVRHRAARDPDLGATRVLAAAADQLGQVLEQDRLRSEAASAEVARRSDALKSALLDSVSHDLRTPLSVIRAAAGTLMSEGRAGGDGGEAAQQIDDEAARLDRIVGNLLEMGRIEGGELRPTLEPYALEDLVEATVRRLRPVLGGRTVVIEIPDDLPWVLVDANLLDQVLSNLLENAARHAPDALIRLAAGRAEDGTGRVRLSVEDGGPGVPDAELGRIFEKFHRVARTAAASGRGTGIGLAVVRGLVEVMGGEVSAAPSALGGLGVDVLLPSSGEPG